MARAPTAWRDASGAPPCASWTRARRRAARPRFVPEITPADLGPGPSGVRGQAVARDGTLLDDFLVDDDGAALHVRNAPSPAATACLALARELADRLSGG